MRYVNKQDDGSYLIPIHFGQYRAEPTPTGWHVYATPHGDEEPTDLGKVPARVSERADGSTYRDLKPALEFIFDYDGEHFHALIDSLHDLKYRYFLNDDPTDAEEETDKGARALLKRWRERPHVPIASPIDVAHMDDPKAFREEQDAAKARFYGHTKEFTAEARKFVAVHS